MGYYSGNVESVLYAPVDIIFSILDYEKFENKFSAIVQEMSREDANR